MLSSMLPYPSLSTLLLLLLLGIASANEAFSGMCGGQPSGFAKVSDCRRLLPRVRNDTGLVGWPTAIRKGPVKIWVSGTCVLVVQFDAMGKDTFDHNTTYVDVFRAFESVISNCTDVAADRIAGSIMVDPDLVAVVERTATGTKSFFKGSFWRTKF